MNTAVSTEREHERTVVGLDIGGSKIAVVEGTRDARILQRREIAPQAERPCGERFPALVSLVKQVIEEAARNGREVRALSVSVGGPLRIREGVLLDPPHLPGWHGVRLKERLEESFPALPAYVEHDGNAGALAEFRFGVGRKRPGLQHLIFLTFGTGLGAGFIVNGQILHGASDSAGEIGHWRLSRSGPEGFGKSGSWEGFSSGAGLVKLAAARFPHRWQAQTPIRALV